MDDIIAKSKKLAVIIFDAFKLSKRLNLSELNDFTRAELEGYSQERIVKGRDYSYRTIEGYLIPAKIGKIQLGLNQTIEDFWTQVEEDTNFFEQVFIFPKTINSIESQLPKLDLYRKGIFQLTTKSSKFFDSEKDYDITFIAKREVLKNLYSKIGNKLQTLILSYL